MGSNCSTLVIEWLLFSYETSCSLSLSLSLMKIIWYYWTYYCTAIINPCFDCVDAQLTWDFVAYICNKGGFSPYLTLSMLDKIFRRHLTWNVKTCFPGKIKYFKTSFEICTHHAKSLQSILPYKCSIMTSPHTFQKLPIPLRKHAYSNILKILPPKNENFMIKNSDIFIISAQKQIVHKNIDCGYSLESPRRGGSNEYPQSMFFCAEIWKIMYTPVNPSFTI